MVQPSTLDAFRRSLDERFRQLLTDLDAVVGAFAAHGPGPGRIGPITKLVEAARDLHDYLSEQDRPAWLVQIYKYGTSFLQHHQDKAGARQFLEVLLKNYRSVRQIEFADNAPLLDFDGVFNRYRDTGKLPELFDQLI